MTWPSQRAGSSTKRLCVSRRSGVLTNSSSTQQRQPGQPTRCGALVSLAAKKRSHLYGRRAALSRALLVGTRSQSREVLCFGPFFAMQAHAIHSELGSRLPPAVPGVAQSTALFKGVFRQNGPEALAGHRCAWNQPLLYACLHASPMGTDNRTGTHKYTAPSTGVVQRCDLHALHAGCAHRCGVSCRLQC